MKPNLTRVQKRLPLVKRKCNRRIRGKKSNSSVPASTKSICCLPKLDGQLPTETERFYLSTTDQDPLLKEATTGFRLFVQKFSDQHLEQCLKNPTFNNLKRLIPSNLRYLQVMRNAWKSLSEFERRDWENNCKQVNRKHLKQQEGLVQRQWLSTIDSDHLPCPLCSKENSKRYAVTKLLAHLTLSHYALHLYACHFCHNAFTCVDDLSGHDCEHFSQFIQENRQRMDKDVVFDFVYALLACVGCGLQVILSPRSEETLADTLLSLFLSHSTDDLMLCLTYSAVEIYEPIKVQFVRNNVMLKSTLVCPKCEGLTIDGPLEFEKHLSKVHRSEMEARKCTKCPASFCLQTLLQDHILVQHIGLDQPLLATLFFRQFPTLPSALDQSENALICGSNLQIETTENLFQNKSLDNIRQSKRKRKVKRMHSPSGTVDDNSIDQCANNKQNMRTLGEWKEEMTKCFEREGMAKFKSQLELNIYFSGTKIVMHNPLNGAILNDNAFQCAKCWEICLGEDKAKFHLSMCFPTLPKEKLDEILNDNSKQYFHHIFDANNLFPFERITCALCPNVRSCSIPALRIHFAEHHNIVCRFQHNKSTIQECAAHLQKAEWLNTDFDRELHRQIDSSKLPQCTSELDSSTLMENYSPTILSKDPIYNIQSNNGSQIECKEELVDEGYERSLSLERRKILHDLYNPSTSPSSVPIKQEWVDDQGVNPKNPNFLTNCKRSSNRRENIIKSNNVSKKSTAEETTTDHGTLKVHLDPILTNAANVCFICAFPEKGHASLELHLFNHFEQWECCPLCAKNSINANSVSFKHPSEFFAHMQKAHMDITNERVQCHFCNHSASIDQPNELYETVAEMFRHIVFECTQTDICFLCGYSLATIQSSITCPATTRRQVIAEVFNDHRWHQHRLIFDRFICSSCKFGFYSREKFIEHRCQLALRCICSPSIRFRTRSEFSVHLQRSIKQSVRDLLPFRFEFLQRNGEKKVVHNLLKSTPERNIGERRYLLNDEYQRMLLNRISKRGSILDVNKLTAINMGKNKNIDTTKKRTNSSGSSQNLQFETVAKKSRTQFVKVFANKESISMKCTQPSHPSQTGLKERKLSEDFGEIDVAVNSVMTSIVEEVAKSVEEKKPERDDCDDDITILGEGIRSQEHSTPSNDGKLATNKFTCDMCSQIFHKRPILEQHRRTAHGPRPLPIDLVTTLCRKCCVAFQDLDHFTSHIESHGSPFACRWCSNVVDTEVGHEWHNSHHPNDYVCTICALRFKNELVMIYHLKVVHQKAMAYFCKKCGLCSMDILIVLKHIFVRTEQCVKDLDANYVGACDASQIHFWPTYPKSIGENSSELISVTECRHVCLQASRIPNEPLLTCNDCLCLIPLNKWKDTFLEMNALYDVLGQCKLGRIDGDTNSQAYVLYKLLRIEKTAALRKLIEAKLLQTVKMEAPVNNVVLSKMPTPKARLLPKVIRPRSDVTSTSLQWKFINPVPRPSIKHHSFSSTSPSSNTSSGFPKESRDDEIVVVEGSSNSSERLLNGTSRKKNYIDGQNSSQALPISIKQLPLPQLNHEFIEEVEEPPRLYPMSTARSVPRFRPPNNFHKQPRTSSTNRRLDYNIRI